MVEHEHELDDGEVMEYRKKEDEENVFTLGNKDRTKDKGKQKVRNSNEE